LHDAAHTGDRKELGVDDVQKVARRKTVGRSDDVGLAPADELLAGVDRQRAMREGGGEAPKREARTKRAPIGEVERPLIVDLIVRVRAKIDAGRELQPAGRLDEDLVADEQIADLALA